MTAVAHFKSASGASIIGVGEVRHEVGLGRNMYVLWLADSWGWAFCKEAIPT